MRNLTYADFAALWPQASPALVKGIIQAQDAVCPKYGITTAMRLAMMWAQFSHECGAGLEMTESLNYSAEMLRRQWANHFTPEQAQLYGRTDSHAANQVAIGNLAYGGRMGNCPCPDDPTKPSDGFNYRGRGLIQTTGRDGYAAIAKETGLSVLSIPSLLVDPDHALLCGVAEFVSYPHMLSLCDAGDVDHVSRLINGGDIGLEDRRAWYGRWKAHLELA